MSESWSEPTAWEEVSAGEVVQMTYPDGTVLVGKFLRSAVHESLTLVVLELALIGEIPVDVTGAEVRKIVS